MIRLIILMLHLIVYGVWSSSPTTLPTKSRILISTNCSRELFNIKLDLDRSFKGVIFAKDFSDECRVKGTVFSYCNSYKPLLILKRQMYRWLHINSGNTLTNIWMWSSFGVSNRWITWIFCSFGYTNGRKIASEFRCTENCKMFNIEGFDGHKYSNGSRN